LERYKQNRESGWRTNRCVGLILIYMFIRCFLKVWPCRRKLLAITSNRVGYKTSEEDQRRFVNMRI
jgi:hypothetical protein